ncbi:MAG: hypothetical protein Q9201_005820 [Fulgogasparrea decipioides]
MSSWSRFWPSGGRYSPFAAAPSHAPPTVTEADFSYLGPDDIDPSSQLRNDSYGFPASGPHRSTRADSNTPDILVLKHRSTTYPLHFPAYAIADGDVTVGELRRLAARETKTDDHHRIKLLYKGKILRDDSRPCRDEGLKQNSEVMCVVSETPSFPSHQQSSSSASEDEMIENGIVGPRVDVDGTIRDDRPARTRRKGHRGGRSKRKAPTPKDSATYLSAPETPYSTHHDRAHSPARTHSPAPTRPTPSPAAPSPPQQSSQPPPPPPPAKPGKLTPRETLDALASRFHTEFVPQCKTFTSNPPADAKTRDFEYKKLSETILAQIILKLDAVETEGDEGLRAKRKELVRETQAMLATLDSVGKAGGS